VTQEGDGVDTHYGTGAGYPQDKAGVEALSQAGIQEFMAECQVEPSDPKNCLACYAYMVFMGVNEDAEPLNINWEAKYRAAHEEILDRQKTVQDLKDQRRWLLSAGKKLAYHLNRWGELHHWKAAGSIITDTKQALGEWEEISASAQD